MTDSIKYRIYPDGRVVHEDDFWEEDNFQPYYDDYKEVLVSSLIVEHIKAEILGK